MDTAAFTTASAPCLSPGVLSQKENCLGTLKIAGTSPSALYVATYFILIETSGMVIFKSLIL